MDLHLFEMEEAYADFLHDESRKMGCAEKIVFPCSTAKVTAVLRVASQKGWPITVQGGRTGIVGGAVPNGGLILNLSRMRSIGAINDGSITVQPGATLDAVRDALKGSGWFFPPDPTETTATIGGMVSANSSGARSFRYGATRGWVSALEVVLPNGETVSLRRGVDRADGGTFRLGSIVGELPFLKLPAVKNAAGYFIEPDMDLIDLFIGAEGTLGVVTEIELRLAREPERWSGLMAFFASESRALNFVRTLREGAEQPVAIEFFDAQALTLLRNLRAEHATFAEWPKLNSTFHTAIYAEFEGDVPEWIVEKTGRAMECWFADGGRGFEQLKKIRHALPEGVNLLNAERQRAVPGLTKLGTDMALPEVGLEVLLQLYRSQLLEAGLEYVIFGHIGENHLHVNILPRTMAEYEAGRGLCHRWAEQIVSMGGSVSAEHGIGKLKTELLQLMIGTDGMNAMRQLKYLFDPAHRLNPGNLM